MTALLISGASDVSWLGRARCDYADRIIFFPEDLPTVERPKATRRAVAICNQCEVAVECRQYADANEIRVGIFGGETGRDRRARWARIRDARRRIGVRACG